MQTFSHPFYDIDIERVSATEEVYLIKILCIDGRRFTYRLEGELDETAVGYIKSLIDAAVFSDMVIVRTAEGFETRESPTNLKKHS
jgi:hypothetical protein